MKDMVKHMPIPRGFRYSNRHLGLHVVVVVALLGAAISFGSRPALATSGSSSFSATGTSQSFIVPDDVTEIQVYLRGGSGGSNQYGYGTPGKGAYVAAVLAVTPGETLVVNVGSKGNQASSTGVFGGGGAGGTPQYGGSTSWFTATGGGASDIRSGGSGLADRIAVAGGGGGNSGFANGGDAGTPNGADGDDAAANGSNAQGGRGATQAAGGSGGAPAGGNCYTAYGQDGELGIGGTGGGGTGAGSATGSGGGGGYYGGGGGGSGCNSGAGGGGSSWVSSIVGTQVTYSLSETADTAGCIEIVWPAGTPASQCIGSTAVTTTTSTTTTSTTTTTTTTTEPATTTTEPATTTTEPATTTTEAAASASGPTTTTSVAATTSVATTATTSSTSTTLPPTSAPAPAEGTSQAVDAEGNSLESSTTDTVNSGNVIIQIRNSDGTALEIGHTQARVETSYSFHRSSPVTIAGQNYPPEVEINVWLNSARTLLGTSMTDSDGAFEVAGVVPSDFELGPHTIEIVATTDSGDHTSLLGIQVVDSASSLPSTGSNGGLPPALILLVTTGLIISLIRRRVED